MIYIGKTTDGYYVYSYEKDCYLYPDGNFHASFNIGGKNMGLFSTREEAHAAIEKYIDKG